MPFDSNGNRQETYGDFRDAVNMSPSELEEWLDTEESRSVGDSDAGESTGHRSGRRIVRDQVEEQGRTRGGQHRPNGEGR